MFTRQAGRCGVSESDEEEEEGAGCGGGAPARPSGSATEISIPPGVAVEERVAWERSAD